jgi:hypothetical protein
MAFRGEASAAGVADIQIGTIEPAAATPTPTLIAPADAFRVRLALGFMLVVAVIDVVLYLPRLI